MSDKIEPGSIVAAVDGSEHAERAVLWAAEQAHLESRRLAIVAVGDRAQAISDDSVRLPRRLHPELAVQALARAGDPREVLIRLSSQARLLVVGSRGCGSLKSLLLGSVSAAVSSYAACPVVVCRPTVAGDHRHGVIVAADGSPESLPVLEFAYHQASLRGLSLTVLHCFWDAAAAVAEYRRALGKEAAAPDLEDLRDVVANSVAGFADTYPDVPVTIELKHGFVDEALRPRDSEWDLIVVGRHPMTSIARAMTGSIATAVLERARTTVAVVPQAPAR